MEFLDEIRGALAVSLGDTIGETLALGVTGSVARGDHGPQSDIDIFVIVKEKKSDTDMLWWRRINDALKRFHRDVTVIVYSERGLRKISNWYVLRLASEGILLFDNANIKALFEAILKLARDYGMVEKEVGGRKVWTKPGLRFGDDLFLELDVK